MVNDRIVFNDEDEFRRFMESIVNKESSYLDSLQTVINFESLRSDTERLAEVLNKDTDELEVVEDPFFATVLNPEGEFQFGDVVYKITRNYVYHVPENSTDYLTSISLRDHEHAVLSKKISHHPDVEVFEIQRSGVGLVNKSNTTARKVTCESDFVDRRRLKWKFATLWHQKMANLGKEKFQTVT